MARVSSTVTKRTSNPRPRKYASASERQAAYRARAPEVCFRAEQKTVETLDRIAETLDQSRADVLLSMTKFALANHDWARFGLTHKPLPFEYGVNPVEKFTPSQLNALRREWSTIKRVDPASPTYKELVKYLNGLPQGMLEQLADARPAIPFVSGMALNRVKRKTNPMKTTRAKRKPTPAQLAARERFAQMARSGAFAKGRRRNPATLPPYIMQRIQAGIDTGLLTKNSTYAVVEGVVGFVRGQSQEDHEKMIAAAMKVLREKTGRKRNPAGSGPVKMKIRGSETPDNPEGLIVTEAGALRWAKQNMPKDLKRAGFVPSVVAGARGWSINYGAAVPGHSTYSRNPARKAAPKRERMLNISWLTPGGEREVMSVPIEFTFTEYVGNVAERFFARLENGFLIVSEYSTGGRVGQVPHTMRAAALNDNAAAKQFTREMIQRVGPERFRAAIKKFSKIN